MSEFDGVESLLEKWRGRVDELEGRPEEIREEQDSFYKGSWDAARERAEPELKRKAMQGCVEDLKVSSEPEEFLESLADWRKEADELDKRILDSNEWFRSHITRLQLEECIEEFEEAFPDSYFEECRSCGSQKNPIRDERYGKGFRWECPECPAL